MMPSQNISSHHNRNLPLSLGRVKNVMKGYCPPTSMGLPITLISHLFLVYKLTKLYDVTHSCVPFNLCNTSCGFMPKEVDWGGKHLINFVVDWQRHETYPTGYNISEVDWGALHDSSFFLFLVNIDYDAKPKHFFTP